MNRVSITAMHQYCRHMLGYEQQPGISVFDLVCDALAKDGRPRPSDIGHSQWCDKNAVHIEMTAKNIFVPKVKKKKKISKKKSRSGKKTIDPFLASYEWRKLRMEALKLHGTKCQCCGASPKTGAVLNVDHIKPRKFFPELALSISNLQILCSECNHGKGNWDQTDWR